MILVDRSDVWYEALGVVSAQIDRHKDLFFEFVLVLSRPWLNKPSGVILFKESALCGFFGVAATHCDLIS